jgi:hypothetical protein
VFNLDKLSMFLLCSIEGKCEEHKGMMGSLTVLRSPERLGFALFLRKGARLPRNTLSARGAPIEKKFNPYHDSQNGQFTFGPGGGSVSDGVYRPDEGKPSLIRTGAEGPSRGIGDNAPPLDAITLAQAFPGLINAPAGAVIAVADPIFDLTAPGGQLTSDLSLAYSRSLIQQIQAIDPTFRYDSLGFPNTLDGQMRMINDLRWDRAAVIYKATGDAGPLQVETTRYLQDRADAEYDNAIAAAKAGRLPPAPTERMAMGNFIDKAVKADFRDILGVRDIMAPTSQA